MSWRVSDAVLKARDFDKKNLGYPYWFFTQNMTTSFACLYSIVIWKNVTQKRELELIASVEIAKWCMIVRILTRCDQRS